MKRKSLTNRASFKSNLDKIRKHFQETAGNIDTRWLTIKEPERGSDTRVNIRVLPPWGESAEGFFYFPGGLHYGFEIGGRRRAIACPEASGRGKCPVCAFIAKLRRSDNRDHEKLVSGFGTSIALQRKYWVNVIDRAEPDVIKMYGTNKKFIETILDAEDDITDPENGRDITIIRKGSGSRTRYNYVVRTKATPIKYNPKDMFQLDKDVLEWMRYEDMVNAIEENYGDEMREVGFNPKRSKKAKSINKGKPKIKKYEEDEEEDIDLDEDYESIDDEDEDE